MHYILHQDPYVYVMCVSRAPKQRGSGILSLCPGPVPRQSRPWPVPRCLCQTKLKGAPSNGSFEGDRDMCIDIDIDIDSDLAVSINWGSFKRRLGLFFKGFCA